jgi:hypothetical protein
MRLLTLDSDTSELRVIRNCDALVVCDRSTQRGCAIATDQAQVSYSTKANLSFDGLPCALSFKTGKLFEESGACP